METRFIENYKNYKYICSNTVFKKNYIYLFMHYCTLIIFGPHRVCMSNKIAYFYCHRAVFKITTTKQNKVKYTNHVTNVTVGNFKGGNG